jgi:hypothetical protein
MRANGEWTAWMIVRENVDFNIRFRQLLNRGVTLSITTEELVRVDNRWQPPESSIVNFSEIQARPRFQARTAINHQIRADNTGQTNGSWVMAIGGNERANAAQRIKERLTQIRGNNERWIDAWIAATSNATDIMEMGLAFTTTTLNNDGRTPINWQPFPISGIPVLNFGSTREMHFIVILATHERGVYTPASRPRRVRPLNLQRAPVALRANGRDMLAIQPNIYLSINDGAPILYTRRATIRAVSGAQYRMWRAATPRRPASAQVRFTLS